MRVMSTKREKDARRAAEPFHQKEEPEELELTSPEPKKKEEETGHESNRRNKSAYLSDDNPHARVLRA
jgi:hypothetical protein